MDNEFEKENIIENEDTQVDAEVVETDADDEEVTDKREMKKV